MTDDSLARFVSELTNDLFLRAQTPTPEYLTVNCPNINIKTLDTIAQDLRVNGTVFYEFSSLISGLDFPFGSNLNELSLFCTWPFMATQFLGGQIYLRHWEP